MRPGGRLAVISFHSLEDRIVKNHFNDVDINNDDDELEDTKMDKKLKTNILKFKMNRNKDDLFQSMVKSLWEPINKKVILPTSDEVMENPRARSAKFRVALKV